MQFSPKKLTNIFIFMSVLVLLLIPVVALVKSFYVEQEDLNLELQIIERNEIVEEIEYIVAPTEVPAAVQTSNPNDKRDFDRENEDEDDD